MAPSLEGALDCTSWLSVSSAARYTGGRGRLRPSLAACVAHAAARGNGAGGRGAHAAGTAARPVDDARRLRPPSMRVAGDDLQARRECVHLVEPAEVVIELPLRRPDL